MVEVAAAAAALLKIVTCDYRKSLSSCPKLTAEMLCLHKQILPFTIFQIGIYLLGKELRAFEKLD